MKTVDAGRIGEELAEKALRRERLKVLERNYRFGHLEVDLILWDRKTQTLVFAEVKARSESAVGFPRESVTPQKQRYLKQAAKAYCAVNGYTDTSCRFDVVEVWLESKRVDHIENAF